MPPSRALPYFSVQIPLLALLMRYLNFYGLGVALLSHAVAVLPPRRWPLPVLAILVVMSVGAGIDGAIVEGEWADVSDFVFTTTLWVAVFVIFRVWIDQRRELWRLVADLRRAKRELERHAAEAEELAALRERTRLAREMHDSLGHALVAVNVKLEAAQRLYAVDAGRGDRELEATRELVRGAMAELRRSLADLRAAPGREGLEGALRRLVETVRRRSGLAVALDVAPDVPALDPAVVDALWRMAQDALVNVERHAAASRVRIALDRGADSVRLRIEDDGRGLVAEDLSQPGHFGVTGMAERIAGVGGRFRVAAGGDGGTVVEATVPLGSQEPARELATAVPGAGEAP